MKPVISLLLIAALGLSAGPLPSRIAERYTPRPVRPLVLTNTPRLGQLVRAGNLYLSLNDAVALAIENNLDIEFHRFNRDTAAADLLRAQGGGLTRGLLYTVSEAPTGVGGPTVPLNTGAANRVVPGSSVTTNPLELGALGQVQSNLNITGTIPLSSGPAVPIFDPSIYTRLGWQHQSAPQTNSVVTGIDNLVTENLAGTAGLRKGFASGAQVGGSFDNSYQSLNSPRIAYSPFTTAAIGLTFTQPLSRGFGASLNRRFIRIAQNEGRIVDELFRQQLMATLYGVVRLYYDFVALHEDVRVKEQTVEFAQRLYEDTRAHVEEGASAQVELVRANAQVLSARQELERSRGLLEEQQAILKNVLSRRGAADPVIRNVNIIPTESLGAPEVQVRPLEDLFVEALEKRPDVSVGRLQIQNVNINLEGSRNAVKPQVDIIGTMQNTGLAGEANLLAGRPDVGVFVGGYGSALGQVFRRNYPIYSVGIQLDLPVHNRIAQADLARDQIQLRQTEIRMQQLRNQVRLEVEDATIAMRRAQAAWQAAAEARKLQEQSLDLEMARYENGVSTQFLVLQYQSYVAQARSSEIATRSAFAKARAALQRATGRLLHDFGIDIDQAVKR